MLRDREESDVLFDAMQQTKIPQIIVGYLKLQQAKNETFFDLFIDKKINGRLFYNTCMPNGSKEVRYGNDDFLQEAFKNVVDEMLAQFNNVTLRDVKYEFVMPTSLSDKMNLVITEIMSHIETTREWTQFWEKEIQLQCSNEKKKDLYNMVASNAAYKALVSCIDHSNYILDAPSKRNVAVLIGLCTGKYVSPFLLNTAEFQLHHIAKQSITSKKQNKLDFSVFKQHGITTELAATGQKNPAKKRVKRKKVHA